MLNFSRLSFFIRFRFAISLVLYLFGFISIERVNCCYCVCQSIRVLKLFLCCTHTSLYLFAAQSVFVWRCAFHLHISV